MLLLAGAPIRTPLVTKRVSQAKRHGKVRPRILVASVDRAHWDRDLQAAPARGVYRRLFRVTATAYAPIDRAMEGGHFTSTERDGRSSHGIAVDPHIIPLGTRLWVPGYGHAIADDTGSMIRGHHIDVRLQNEDRMSRWGVRNLRVYVLDDPRK